MRNGLIAQGGEGVFLEDFLTYVSNGVSLQNLVKAVQVRLSLPYTDKLQWPVFAYEVTGRSMEKTLSRDSRTEETIWRGNYHPVIVGTLEEGVYKDYSETTIVGTRESHLRLDDFMKRISQKVLAQDNIRSIEVGFRDDHEGLRMVYEIDEDVIRRPRQRDPKTRTFGWNGSSWNSCLGTLYHTNRHDTEASR
jgi:hypothetical protein